MAARKPLVIVNGQIQQLQSGDTLVMCTDGVLDAQNERGRRYGRERLSHILLEHGGETAQGLLKAIQCDLRRHCGGASREDDLTLVVVNALR